MSLIDGLKGAARGIAEARDSRAARMQDEKPDDWMFCKSCGHEGEPVAHTPGSFFIELVLWICFIIPGLVYSFWRLSRRRKVCAGCRSSDIIPSNSPLARSLRKQLSS